MYIYAVGSIRIVYGWSLRGQVRVQLREGNSSSVFGL